MPYVIIPVEPELLVWLSVQVWSTVNRTDGPLKGAPVRPISATNAREVSSDTFHAMSDKCCCRTAYAPTQSDPLETRTIVNTSAYCKTEFVKE